MNTQPVLKVEGLIRDYVLGRRSLFGPPPRVRALFGIDLELEAGRTLAVVGSSGCGKSTLARTVLALDRPDGGTVHLLGRDLFALSPADLMAMRRHVQMVFQDPYGSLDPRHRVRRIIGEPLDGHGGEQRARIAEALVAVGLRASDGELYPHEFSGGQRQRIAIARALITEPELIVADEPVSALDVSVQAQVLNLMMDLQDRLGISYLFISHDLAVVRHIADQVAVMFKGRIVERAPCDDLFARPAHPYTRALLDAVPKPDPAQRRGGSVIGDLADGDDGGCPFAGRCRRAEPACRGKVPELTEISPGHWAACMFPNG